MNRQDLKWIVLFLVLGALGLNVFVGYYNRAMPVASLNFRFTRAEIYQKAEDYVRAMGHDVSEYKSAQVLSRAGLQQVFLERSVGLEQTNQLARDWVSIWYWHVRWFKSLEKEEVRVRLDPGGRVVGFEHRVLESEPGASLAQEDALLIAEHYLTQTQNFRLENYERIEAASTERAKRLDHTFTYRKHDFTVADEGHYRLRVQVVGDQIGGFSEFLYVPEEFSRDYQETRSRAGLLTNVAMIFWFALGLAMFVILMRKYREGRLRWRGSVVVGIVVTVVMIVTSLNGYPLLIFNYNTQMAFAAFVAVFVFGGILGAMLQGGLVVLSGATGGVVAQEALVEKRNPLTRFSLRNVRSAGFARATLVGYGLAFAHLGYVTLFYLWGADYLGVWSPAGVSEYSNTYSTLLPWIYPLFYGLVAATSEEFFFRLLAISLLIKWTGKRWLAVLIPAIVWAFLHSNYPQEPIFIRGLELTVVGVIFGVVFLRYGIWATVISHYVYNAFQGAYPMMQSDSLYFQISGGLVVGAIFIPALPAIWSVLTGKYREVDGAEEEEEPDVPQPIFEVTAPEKPVVVSKVAEDYAFLARDMKILIVLGIVGLVSWGVFDRDGYGSSYVLQIDRTEAAQKADAVRESLGIDVEGYQQITYFLSSLGGKTHTHLVRSVGPEKAEVLVQEELHPWRWQTRWFKAEEKEEVRIAIDHVGRLGGVTHLLPDNAEGANLALEDAQKIAEGFAVMHLKRDVTDEHVYKVLESQSEKKENRTDHRFVWERVDKKVGEGEFRVEVTVLGDEIGHARTRYKAPEAFLRELNEKGMKSVAINVMHVLLVIVTLSIGIRYLFRLYRQGDVRWQLGIWVGVIMMVWFFLGQMNELVELYKGYNTSQGLMTFLGSKGIGLLIGMVFIGGAGGLIVVLADALIRQDLSEEMSWQGWLDVLSLRAGSATLWVQALLFAVCYKAFEWGRHAFDVYIHYAYLQPYLDMGTRSPRGVDVYFPFLKSFLGASMAPVLIIPLIIGGWLLWRRALGRVTYVVVGLALVVLIQRFVGPADDLYHFSVLLFLGILKYAVLGYLVFCVARYNLLVYICMIWVGLAFGSKGYLEMDLWFYQMNGILMLILGLVPFLMAFLARRNAVRQV